MQSFVFSLQNKLKNGIPQAETNCMLCMGESRNLFTWQTRCVNCQPAIKVSDLPHAHLPVSPSTSQQQSPWLWGHEVKSP